MPTSPLGTLELGLAAFASRRVGMDEMAAFRRPPGLPYNFLRHADEQTVASVAAVLDAAERAGLPRDGFADWGVVAAPRFIGRDTVTNVVARFQNEGAWGVSPHIIPHRSLHSVPGTISQALKLHGPNFAAGSGTGCEAEAFLAGVTLLADANLPGVWVVFSRLDPEGPVDHATGTPSSDSFAHAVALALTAAPAAAKAVLELTPCPTAVGEELTPALLEEFFRHPTSLLIEGLGRLKLKSPAHPLAGPHLPFFAPARTLAEDRT